MEEARPDLPQRWNVAIDAEGDLRAEPVDGSAVESLIDRLSGHSASVSHLPRRYSTRLTVYASGPLEAASDGMAVWRRAVAAAGLPDWPVTRMVTTRVGE